MGDADKTPEIADNETVYDEQIFPLMAQILDICKAHKIPMVASFEYASKELCTSRLLPPGATTSLVRASEVIYGIAATPTFAITLKS